MKLPVRLCPTQARFLNGWRVYLWCEHKNAAFHFKWRLRTTPLDDPDQRALHVKMVRTFGALARDNYQLLVEEMLANA